jgi:hypothetical protein
MDKIKFYGAAFIVIGILAFIFKPSPPQKETTQHSEEKKSSETNTEEVTKKKKKTTKPDGTIIEEETTKNKKKKEKTDEVKTVTVIIKENPVPQLFYGYTASFNRDNKIEYHKPTASYFVKENIQIQGSLKFNTDFKYDGYEIGVLIGHK